MEQVISAWKPNEPGMKVPARGQNKVQPAAVPSLPAHFPSPALAGPTHHWPYRCQVEAFSGARAGCFLSEPFSTASAIPASGKWGKANCVLLEPCREKPEQNGIFRYFKKRHRHLFGTQCCSSGLCFHCLGKAQQENTCFENTDPAFKNRAGLTALWVAVTRCRKSRFLNVYAKYSCDIKKYPRPYVNTNYKHCPFSKKIRVSAIGELSLRQCPVGL